MADRRHLGGSYAHLQVYALVHQPNVGLYLRCHSDTFWDVPDGQGIFFAKILSCSHFFLPAMAGTPHYNIYQQSN